MSSTFSPTLRLELIGDGDQSGIWGQTTNNNLGALIEQAVTGVITISMTDANYTLSNFNGVVDEARNQVLVLTGTLSTQRNLIAPLVEKTYAIKNTTTGGFGVQIIGSSGTGVVIPNGQTILVYCDGTSFYALVTGSATNFNVAGNLAVSGATALAGTLSVTGATTFTGIPSGPTAALGTNTTQLATTAFVLVNGVPSGSIIMWSGSIASIPSGWLLCNGSSGTPDLRDRFVVGAGTTYAVGATGGATSVTLATTNLPSHTHSISATGTTSTESQGHTHTFSGTTSGQSATHSHSASVSDPTHEHFAFAGTNTGNEFNLDSSNYAANRGSFGGDFSYGIGSNGGPVSNIGRTNAVGTGISVSNGDASVDHNHTYSGTTSNISVNHTHSVTVTGTSGATGSATAFGTLPPYYALAYIMKV
jgi:microcystin-dependent protein